MGTAAINGSGSVDAAAQALEQQAAATENAGAREQIRADFVAVAQDDKGGVGSDKAERSVDDMLNKMLPGVDFSKPGGKEAAQEIGGFVRSMGHDMSKGEIAHLEGLLNEATAASSAQPSVEPDDVNVGARQAIRANFVDIAKDDKGGVGSDKVEQQVDKLLFDTLPKIDFRGPVGGAYAKEIGGFITSMGKNISAGEVAHLQGLLNEAAVKSPAGSAAPPAPAEPTTPTTPTGTTGSDGDLTAELQAILNKVAAADSDGTLDPTERADLLKDLTALTAKVDPGTSETSDATPPASPPVNWTVSSPQDGKATIKLGDKYELQLDEASSEMKIVNKQTNETTRIWGDPHVDWNNDGTNDVNFKHTATFELEDHTKITINTEKWGQSDQFISDKVTISNGANSIVVDGLGQQTLGDLKITQHQAQGTEVPLGQVTGQGYVLQENASGAGWIDSGSGKVATQQDVDAADAKFSDGVETATTAAANATGSTQQVLAVVTKAIGALGNGTLDATERAALTKDLASAAVTLAAGQSEDGSASTAKTSTSNAASTSQTQASDTTAATAKKDNSNEVVVGLLRLLIDLLGANDDGKVDATERKGLLKDMVGLMGKLTDDGAVATGSTTSDTSVADTAQKSGGQMHDGSYYLGVTGLGHFLSGYNSDIVNMVNNAMKD
jgi:uncharacterized membrane protein YebE (DUF533 family)